MTWVLRPAVVDDAEAVARVHVETWRDAYDGIVPAERLRAMDPERYTPRWAESLADQGALSYHVAERHSDLLGFVIAGPYRPQQDAAPEDTTGMGELYAIYVLPRAQGSGAGTALHDAALTALVGAGLREAALWVLEQNTPAIRWYRRRGWLPDGALSLWTDAGARLRELRLHRSAELSPEV